MLVYNVKLWVIEAELNIDKCECEIDNDTNGEDVTWYMCHVWVCIKITSRNWDKDNEVKQLMISIMLTLARATMYIT